MTVLGIEVTDSKPITGWEAIQPTNKKPANLSEAAYERDQKLRELDKTRFTEYQGYLNDMGYLNDSYQSDIDKEQASNLNDFIEIDKDDEDFYHCLQYNT